MEFDIESAKLAILCETGRVVTRGGQLVTDIKLDNLDSLDDYPISGKIIVYSHELTWTCSGKYFADGRRSMYDLFIAELC